MLLINFFYIPLPSNTQQSGVCYWNLLATTSNFCNTKYLYRQKKQGRKIEAGECKGHSLQGHRPQLPHLERGPIALPQQVAVIMWERRSLHLILRHSKYLLSAGPSPDGNHNGMMLYFQVFYCKCPISLWCIKGRIMTHFFRLSSTSPDS